MKSKRTRSPPKRTIADTVLENPRLICEGKVARLLAKPSKKHTPQQHISYQRLLEIWQEADREPLIDHMWLFDHFMPLREPTDGLCFEGWTLLAALAAQTERVRLGHLVTDITYRHPAIMTRQAVTVDYISGERLNFGKGISRTCQNMYL